MVAESGVVRSFKSYFQARMWGRAWGLAKPIHGPDWRSQLSSIEKCNMEGREGDSVVAYLEGVLLRSPNSYAYFMLVAYEAGSPLRALLLLLLSPLLLALQYLFSEELGLRGFILISFAGLKASHISLTSRATLCKFYMRDMRLSACRVFTCCGGRRFVVTLNPRIMVEPFLKEYIGVERVIGTEVHTLYGYCTGLLTAEGICNPASFSRHFQGLPEEGIIAVNKEVPKLGLISNYHHHNPFHNSFMYLCKEVYAVAALGSESELESERVPRENYLKPLVFHDGRLAMKPTPLMMLLIFLWMPIGVVLSLLRTMACLYFPVELAMPLSAFLGIRIRVRGGAPLRRHASDRTARGGSGVLFVCTHRTLLDPIFLMGAIRRKLSVVTYSISRLSELISPIKTVRLTRNRELDAKAIDKLLQEGDLVICPEGTTCREPYLLRFSPLFAELTDEICPVAMKTSVDFFYGTTVSGWKSFDCFYFLMNPRPEYEVNILDPLPKLESCSAGKSSIHVANYLQQQLALTLGYECTNFTRRDKYRLLASNDSCL